MLRTWRPSWRRLVTRGLVGMRKAGRRTTFSTVSNANCPFEPQLRTGAPLRGALSAIHRGQRARERDGQKARDTTLRRWRPRLRTRSRLRDPALGGRRPPFIPRAGSLISGPPPPVDTLPPPILRACAPMPVYVRPCPPGALRRCMAAFSSSNSPMGIFPSRWAAGPFLRRFPLDAFVNAFLDALREGTPDRLVNTE